MRARVSERRQKSRVYLLVRARVGEGVGKDASVCQLAIACMRADEQKHAGKHTYKHQEHCSGA